jgi:secondary-alkyl amine dehydrogenase [NAD(P)+]
MTKSATRSTGKPRIALYGMGQFGQIMARIAAGKNWPIVAAYNRAGPKIGQDVGLLSGAGRALGVLVQDCETANFDQLEADVGIVTTTNILKQNFPAYSRFMNAGANVICHGTDAYNPYNSDPVVAAAIDKLAKEKGVTFSGSGIWDFSRIWAGILVAGPCTEIFALKHRSQTSLLRAVDEKVLREQQSAFGVGYTVAEFKENGNCDNPIAHSYMGVPQIVLKHLGYTVTESRSHVEPVIFDAPIDCPPLGMIVPPGRTVGSRLVGEVHTKEGVTATMEVEVRLFRDDEIEYMRWEVDGKPQSRIRIEREDTIHSSASCVFNRIPDVIAAPAGIVTITQLGPMKPSALL